MSMVVPQSPGPEFAAPSPDLNAGDFAAVEGSEAAAAADVKDVMQREALQSLEILRSMLASGIESNGVDRPPTQPQPSRPPAAPHPGAAAAAAAMPLSSFSASWGSLKEAFHSGGPRTTEPDAGFKKMEDPVTLAGFFSSAEREAKSVSYAFSFALGDAPVSVPPCPQSSFHAETQADRAPHRVTGWLSMLAKHDGCQRPVTKREV